MLTIAQTKREALQAWLDAYIDRVTNDSAFGDYNVDSNDFYNVCEFYNLSDLCVYSMKSVHVNNAKKLGKILKCAVKTKPHDDKYDTVYFTYRGWEVFNLVPTKKGEN